MWLKLCILVQKCIIAAIFSHQLELSDLYNMNSCEKNENDQLFEYETDFLTFISKDCKNVVISHTVFVSMV